MKISFLLQSILCERGHKVILLLPGNLSIPGNIINQLAPFNPFLSAFCLAMLNPFYEKCEQTF